MVRNTFACQILRGETMHDVVAAVYQEASACSCAFPALTILGRLPLGKACYVRLTLDCHPESFSALVNALLTKRGVVASEPGKGYVRREGGEERGTLRVGLMHATPLESDHRVYVGTTHPHWQRQFQR